MSGFGCYLTSLLQGYADQEKAIDLKGIDFSTSKSFNINSLIVITVLVLIYGVFW
jgi:SSS family solute:Na+ symporter